MKLTVLALDYDGTLAMNDAMEPPVRAAIAHARTSGIMIFVVTGRTLRDLRRVAGSLHMFDAVVAEDGGVVHFPATDYSVRVCTHCVGLCTRCDRDGGRW